MDASIRPWFTTGVAFVGASAIAIAPIAPIPTTTPMEQVRSATAAVSAQFDLTAIDIPYILTLPIVRQYLRNYVENWAVFLGGFAQSGVGVVQSLLSIPGVTVEAIQQVLALDFVGAFETVTAALRDATIAIGQPLVDSLVWRYEKYYGVAAELGAAVPQAYIDVINGFLLAGNVVVTSGIQGTQDLIAAFLTFNLGNIVDAAVGGTVNFLGALVDGGGLIVDGIESAQFGIASALAFDPGAPGFAANDVSTLRTLSVEDTITVPAGPEGAVPEATESPVVEELSAVEGDTTGDIAPQEVAPAAAEPAVEVDGLKAADIEPPAKLVNPTPEKVEPVKINAPDVPEVNAPAAAEKPAAANTDTDAPKDKPAADKPSNDNGGAE